MTEPKVSREDNSSQIPDLDAKTFNDLLDTYARSFYWGGPSGHTMEKFAIHQYVNALLASRDAEIERLTARQITPDIEALHRSWLEVKDIYPPPLAISASQGIRSDLWHAFIKMMEGDK